MPNPLEEAAKAAGDNTEALGELFTRLGSADHPNGVVTKAYRNARRAMTIALGEDQYVTAVNEVVSGLKLQLRSGVMDLFHETQVLGRNQAARQLNLFGVEAKAGSRLPVGLLEQSDGAMRAVMARVAAQEAQITALLAMGGDLSLILGDGDRMGYMNPWDVTRTAAFYLAALNGSAFGDMIPQSYGFKKQAVAALDRRTTDCCLRVHGQIVPFNAPFHLTGTPRFADDLDWSPFHWWCRTSVIIYLPEYDDGLTSRMVAGARQVLAEREAGIEIDRNPANAFLEI